MPSYPGVIVGLRQEDRAAYVRRCVREGDEITLERRRDNLDTPEVLACFHGGQCVGYIPQAASWAGPSIAQRRLHKIKVTGFDTGADGELAGVEIEVTIAGEESEPLSTSAIKSMISELGDELRILAMMATADGQFAAPERALLEHFAKARAAELGLDPDGEEAAYAVRWAGRKPASSLDAAKIIARLAQERPQALAVIWDFCELMAEIDGQVRAEEKLTMTTLRSLIEQALKAAKPKGS